jgi:YbbR domain-containing protein
MMERLQKLVATIGRGVRDIFVRNFHLKAVALLLTFALYLWVGEDRETQIIATAPLQFSVPENQMLLEPETDQAKVTLRGRWSTLNEFDQTNLRPIVVELSKSDDGRLVSIEPESVQVPPGLRVVSIEPSFVRVDLEETVSREVAIEPRIVGRTRGSYRLGEVDVDPDEVTVSGPENVMENLGSIPTEPIDVTGRVRSFKKQVQLRPENSLINYNLDGPVTVSVPIRAERVEKTVDEVEVSAVNTTYRTDVSPKALKVTLQGPRSVLDDLDSESIHAVVELSEQDDLPPGTFEKKVEVRNLPPDVELVEMHPQYFVVETLERADEDGEAAD